MPLPRFLCLQLLAIAMLFTAVQPVSAQFNGPVSPATTTAVASILINPVDDQPVLLTGKIMQKIAHDKYVFSDDKDSIVAEIDAHLFPHQEITPSTTVEVWGEVEKDYLEAPEIDVKSLRIVP